MVIDLCGGSCLIDDEVDPTLIVCDVDGRLGEENYDKVLFSLSAYLTALGGPCV